MAPKSSSESEAKSAGQAAPLRPIGPAPSRRGRPRFLKDLVPIVSAGAIALFARTSLADHYVVPTGSMQPTVMVGDRILVDKTAFGLRLPFIEAYAIPLRDPQVNDVVVLSSPEDGTTLLKRVVAVPGDEVAVREGHVVRNGAVQPRPVEAATDDGGPDFGPMRVPEHRYLVLGDNRGNSKDGRWFGFVSRDAIRGRARRVFVRDGRAAWQPL